MRVAELFTSLVLFISAMIPLNSQQGKTITDAEAEGIAVEAYIYGYPLVTMDLTKRVMTNIAAPGDSKAPIGQFYNARTYPDASFKDVTAPNADTLYSVAWLDLSKEPYILHTPNEQGRYFLMPLLSGWTNVIDDPGKRTTGTEAADYLITGPGWKGEVPAGMKEIKSPTNMVWILGRTYSTGTPEDYDAVHKIQDQYTLTPLSAFGKPYTPPNGVVDHSIDMKTPVRDQVNKMDGATYFNQLAQLMKDNPPAPEDAPIVEKMAKIGIIPGQEFDINKLDPAIARAFARAPQAGLQKIIAQQKNAGTLANGWLISTHLGQYGTDYPQRAYVTAIGLGANLPQDAIYPVGETDSEGQPLNGANRYVMHFPKGQTPPVKGFWSLTMYNNQFFFVPNPLNRYTLSPRNQLTYNSDGSLDLYIQNAFPGKEKESNWLPAPKDQFVLMLRLYWPEEAVINGAWKPPAIKRVK